MIGSVCVQAKSSPLFVAAILGNPLLRLDEVIPTCMGSPRDSLPETLRIITYPLSSCVANQLVYTVPSDATERSTRPMELPSEMVTGSVNVSPLLSDTAS